MAYSENFHPTLRSGDRNLAVRAAQNALHRALHKKGLPHKNNRSGGYGSNTVKDVEAFKRAYNVRIGGKPSVNGNTIGEAAWKKLIPFLGKVDKTYLARYKVKAAAKRARERALLAITQRLAKMLKTASEAARLEQMPLIYRQMRPFPLSDDFSVINNRLDCSSFATLCYWLAGRPDPNGFGYGNGREAYGYTGSLWPRGHFVSWADAKPGDLVFYGYASDGNYPSHVAVLDTDMNYVRSFGSTPPKRLDWDYRGVRGIKRYE